MSEKKVLIVDDAVFMRSMQKRIISGSGDYEVYEAGDGEEAVVLYEKIKAGPGAPGYFHAGNERDRGIKTDERDR